VDDDGRPNSIPGLYALLDPHPLRTDTGRRGPGFASRSPASDHIIAITDHRSQRYDPGDPHSAPGLLTSWVQWVWSERYEPTALDQPDYLTRLATLPRTVATAAPWLDQQLDWLTRQDTVADLHLELGELHSQLRAATGEPTSPPLGHCIELLDTGECEAPIRMPAGTQPRAPDEPIKDLPAVQCPRCGTTYDGARLLRLRLANEREQRRAGDPAA